MSAIEDDRAPQPGSHVGTWRAIVATNATDLDTEVMVIVPAFHPQLQWGPCKWMPRGDSISFPTRGDQALIVYDEEQTPWIIAWWPF
jgi:hypothetical protein